jgi:hypothetical protein
MCHLTAFLAVVTFTTSGVYFPQFGMLTKSGQKTGPPKQPEQSASAQV